MKGNMAELPGISLTILLCRCSWVSTCFHIKAKTPPLPKDHPPPPQVKSKPILCLAQANVIQLIHTAHH